MFLKKAAIIVAFFYAKLLAVFILAMAMNKAPVKSTILAPHNNHE